MFDKSVFRFLLLVLACTTFASHAQSWVSKAPMPQARASTAAAAVGGKIHAVGGYQGGATCSYLNRNDVYDPGTNSWTAKASLPWNPDGASAEAVNGTLHVLGGLTDCGSAFANHATYDPVADTWTARAPMPTARGRFGVGVINGVLYAVGGSVGGGTPDTIVGSLEAYDATTNTWTTKAPMPTPRQGLGVGVMGGKLYAVGGWTGSAGVATVEVYDPIANTWSARSPMPTPRPDLAVAVVGSTLYAIGGGYTIPPSAVVEAYDPATNAWATAPAMNAGRYAPAAVSIGGTIYAIGGISAGNVVTASVEAFNAPVQPLGLSVSPDSLDFGAQSMMTTSPSMPVSIRNDGTIPLTVTSVAASSAFAVSHDCGTLAAGSTCTASVSFTPLLQGQAAGTIAVQSTGGAGSVALSGMGERSLVVHYYRSILRRAPDGPGKAFWEAEAARVAALGTDPNETWYAMAMYFLASAEYASFNRDDDSFITDLYRAFFNRAPDGPGLAFWAGQLSGGLPREVALLSFLLSPEFVTFTRAIFGDTPVRREIDAVVDYYRGLLARLPDDGGFGYWLNRFRAAQCAGASAIGVEADAMAGSFTAGGEYSSRARSNAQFVGDLYNAFMRRGGDLQGVQFWINALGSGAMTRDDVRREFVASVEFKARLLDIASAGCKLEDARLSNAARDGLLASARFVDGTVVEYVGTRLSTGMPEALNGITVERAGEVTKVELDAQSRIARIEDPAGTVLRYEYPSGGGNLVSATTFDGRQALVPGSAAAKSTIGPRSDVIGVNAIACGAPADIDSVFVRVGAPGQAPLLSFPARKIYAGYFEASIPDSLAQSTDKAALADDVIEKIDLACEANDAAPTITASACLALAAAALPIGASVPVGAACAAAVGALRFYCAFSGPGRSPNAIAELVVKPFMKRRITDWQELQALGNVQVTAHALGRGDVFDPVSAQAPRLGPYPELTIVARDDVCPGRCRYQYSDWSSCQPGNTQTRTVVTYEPFGCTRPPPLLEQACTYVPPQPCSYTYTSWSACVNGTQTRSVLFASPPGCVGSPVLSQSCGNACCGCVFDVYCTAFPPGLGCWRCTNGNFQPDNSCSAPGLSWVGVCDCSDPGQYRVCN